MGLFTSLLGGLFTSGLFGGGKGKGALQVVGNVLGNKSAEKRQDTTISRVVADARAAGVHPGYALGGSVAGSYGLPVNSGGPTYDGVSGRRVALENRLLEAQISSEEAKRLALLSEARSTSMSSQARAGATGGPMPLWVQVVDRDGNLLWVPNPDLPDLDQMAIPAAAHAATPFVGGDGETPPIVAGPRSRPRNRPADRSQTGAGRSRGSLRW